MTHDSARRLVGLLVDEVNSEKFGSSTHQEVLRTIKAAGRPLTLGFRGLMTVDEADKARVSVSGLSAAEEQRDRLVLEHFQMAAKLGRWTLGDASSLGRIQRKLNGRAAELGVYSAAVKAGLWQRPEQHPNQHFDPSLRARPWWDPSEIPFVRLFKSNWKMIRDEYLKAVREL